MVGFYATGDPCEPVRVDLDKELEGTSCQCGSAYFPRFNLLLDARWYTREEVLAVLQHNEGTSFTRTDHRQFEKSTEERVNVNHMSGDDPLGGDAVVHDNPPRVTPAPVVFDADEPLFRVPPRTAIAGVLISDWAFGYAHALKGRM
jgi:NAD+ diphosphatase